jgi:hypothetical protein
MGWIRGNVELGVCARAVGGSGFMGWIRENVDLGFCAGAVGGSGFMGWIRGNVELGYCAGAGGGSGFIGDSLNGAVGPGVDARRGGRLAGARGPVAWVASPRSGRLSPVYGVLQRSLPWIAGERRGQPLRVRAPQWEARSRFGLSRGLVVVDGRGRRAAGSAGVAAVKAAFGIAGFLAVCLTNMVVVPNLSDKESRSVATARNAPRRQRRGGSILADEDRVDKS